MAQPHDPASEPATTLRGAVAEFLARGGVMGALMRTRDWSATPFGPVEAWPQSLRTAASILLNSRYPMFLGWGPALCMLYNDAYRPVLGATKHPGALGRPMREVWAEIWDTIGPLADRAVRDGEPTWSDDLVLMMSRHGYLEETYFTFSYSPIRDETGGVGGMLCVCSETTGRVVGERRLRVLRDLAASAAKADGVAAVQARCLAALDGARADLPFALLYAQEEEGGAWRLRGAAGDRGRLAAAEHPPWPLDAVGRGEVVALDAPADALPDAARPRSPWGDPVAAALALPVADRGHDRVGMALVLGVSPRRALDDEYRDFLGLVASGVATALADAGAFEAERRRAEALAELDRAKTAFFSSVSHEFRTPLTLMLGPLEEAMAAGQALPPEAAERVAVAHRNALRLLRLVNTLLDFSRVEAGRAQARFAPTDLAALTTDLASAFRSACDRAGLALEVDCPPLPEPVQVDREMWEKIVLNLVSNAFKFTFEGGIAVALRARDGRAELTVRDTGTGIPAAELPRLFDRFHRVEGAAGRSHEGSGIGLALVRELVRLHGGEVSVESEPGRGSAFTVRVPLGTAHLPPEARTAAPAATPVAASTAVRVEAFVEEALRWLPPEGEGPQAPAAWGAGTVAASDVAGGEGPRVLIADDNADMRDYLGRLLRAAGYRVAAAADGEAALAAALADPPALVLSDVMMPRLDGFGLLRALRADPRTREAPVLLLSARAGEEAEVEGLDAGADDYVVKPFVARELLARINANLRLARLRREAAAARREGEARWRDLVERMREGFVIGELIHGPDGTAEDFRCLEVSGGWEAMTGVPRAGVAGRRASELFPGLEDRWTRAFARVVETGEPAHLEDYAAPLGRWFEVSAYRIGPGRFGCLFLDVTERRAAAERQALLVREVDHRAKNALAVVQSVLRLTRADDMRAYARAVEGRVAALARAHALLAADRWRGAELRAVVEEELAAYRGGGRVSIAGPELRLRAEAVQPLSMVVHELATNAAKYGALSVPGGRVAVSWRRDAPGGGLRLLWEELDGPVILVPPERKGFGSTLIEATARGQLGGAVEFRWPAEGLRCEVAIAADWVAPGAAAPGEEAAGGAAGWDPEGGADPTGRQVSLRGRAVLVAEDEALVALEMAQTLASLGCQAVGPAATLEEALRLATAEAGRLDAAVLDVNLHGRAAFPVADLLAARGVPVVWATGYGELPPGGPGAAGSELLRKPLAQGDLEAALRRALGGAGRRPVLAEARPGTARSPGA